MQDKLPVKQVRYVDEMEKAKKKFITGNNSKSRMYNIDGQSFYLFIHDHQCFPEKQAIGPLVEFINGAAKPICSCSVPELWQDSLAIIMFLIFV